MKRLILIFGMVCALGAAPVFAQEAGAEVGGLTRSGVGGDQR